MLTGITAFWIFRRIRNVFPGLLLVFLISPLAHAQASKFELDPAASSVTFTLGATLHTVHGTFKLKQGSVDFDPDTGKAGGMVIVDAVSGETGNTDRDRNMHQKILESAKYNEIRFVPSQVRGRLMRQGDSHLDVAGTISLHGQDHEIVLPVDVHADGERLTADIGFAVPYVKWGLKNPSTFVLRVSDTVQVKIQAAGHLNALPEK